MNKMKLNYEVMNLANDINKNYHGWLSCVTLTSEYKKESRDFGHGFGVFTGSKYYRIEASGKSGCNSIIDQENSKLYVTPIKLNMFGALLQNLILKTINAVIF